MLSPETKKLQEKFTLVKQITPGLSAPFASPKLRLGESNHYSYLNNEICLRSDSLRSSEGYRILIHEISHRQITRYGCFKDKRFNKKYKYHKAFLQLLNILEDIRIEAFMSQLRYPNLRSEFLELKPRIIDKSNAS